jgi:hypothetical protein
MALRNGFQLRFTLKKHIVEYRQNIHAISDRLVTMVTGIPTYWGYFFKTPHKRVAVTKAPKPSIKKRRFGFKRNFCCGEFISFFAIRLVKGEGLKDIKQALLGFNRFHLYDIYNKCKSHGEINISFWNFKMKPFGDKRNSNHHKKT